MSDLLRTMASLTAQLRKLEKQIDLHEFESARPVTSLGRNPAQGFAIITEFKAAIDRMRYITWMYMDAAATSANIPVQAVPPALRRRHSDKYGHSCTIDEYLDSKEGTFTTR